MVCSWKHFLMFVDDLALVTEKDKDMKRNVEVLNEVTTKWKMKINWENTNSAEGRWHMSHSRRWSRGGRSADSKIFGGHV